MFLVEPFLKSIYVISLHLSYIGGREFNFEVITKKFILLCLSSVVKAHYSEGKTKCLEMRLDLS